MFDRVVSHKPKAIILTSGTLQPDTWKLETGIEFKSPPRIP
jgi:hypothetical protein